MASDDEERTVFGQKIPPQPARPGQGQPQPPQQPPAAPAPQSAPPPPQTGERTVFGVNVPSPQPQPQPQPGYPPQAQPPQPGYPPQAPAPGYPPPHNAGPPPGSEDTWLGGALSPKGGAVPPAAHPPSPQPPAAPPYQPPQAQPPYAPPPPQPYPAQPYPPQGYPPPQQPYVPPAQPPGYPPPQDPYAQGGYAPPPPQAPFGAPPDAQFPPTGPTAAPPPPRNQPKIAFTDALRGAGLDVGASTNPMLAAASDLLVLLGRLRTGLVEMQAIPLRDHVLREIANFVQKCQSQGLPPDDIDAARYALAATADDIVQTIPGNDPQYWQQFSMAAELLGDRSAGIGFFNRLEQVIAYPSQRAHVLELMLTCLALGFEGKYRTNPNGTVALARLRAEVYHRYRSATRRPEEELSHKWLPVILRGKRVAMGVPLWIVGGVSAAMVVALFAALAWVLSSDAQAAQDRIVTLHNKDQTLTLEGTVELTTDDTYEADPTGQLERIQGRLSQEISAGLTQVNEQGDYISIFLGDALRFGSGSAELQTDVSQLMKRIADALEAEPGGIIVEGHSDNIPLRGTGRYRSNEALSEARAGTVRDVLVPNLSDPARVSVIGVGPARPVDPANTAEARAKNRRVEILLRKEELL